jgi:hypothetical protein
VGERRPPRRRAYSGVNNFHEKPLSSTENISPAGRGR